jgi:hypothetical protein
VPTRSSRQDCRQQHRSPPGWRTPARPKPQTLHPRSTWNIAPGRRFGQRVISRRTARCYGGHRAAGAGSGLVGERGRTGLVLATSRSMRSGRGASGQRVQGARRSRTGRTDVVAVLRSAPGHPTPASAHLRRTRLADRTRDLDVAAASTGATAAEELVRRGGPYHPGDPSPSPPPSSSVGHGLVGGARHE